MTSRQPIVKRKASHPSTTTFRGFGLSFRKSYREPQAHPPPTWCGDYWGKTPGRVGLKSDIDSKQFRKSATKNRWLFLRFAKNIPNVLYLITSLTLINFVRNTFGVQIVLLQTISTSTWSKS
jgi:hypothetical protein